MIDIFIFYFFNQAFCFYRKLRAHHQEGINLRGRDLLKIHCTEYARPQSVQPCHISAMQNVKPLNLRAGFSLCFCPSSKCMHLHFCNLIWYATFLSPVFIITVLLETAPFPVQSSFFFQACLLLPNGKNLLLFIIVHFTNFNSICLVKYQFILLYPEL